MLSNSRYRLVWVVTSAVFVVSLFCSGVLGQDWPNWRGPDHNGISSETGWDAGKVKDGQAPLWQVKIGVGFSSMAVTGGKVYTMGNAEKKDIVYCLDAETGKELWNYPYDEPLESNNYEGGPNATPTVSGSRVYTLSKQGKVFCLDAETGSVVWSKDLKGELGIKPPRWGLSGSPLVLDDMVILNAGTNGIALNKADGSVVWQSGKKESGYSTPVAFEADGKKLVALFTSKTMVVVEAATGNVVAEQPWKTSWNVNAADPIISDGKILISSGYNVGAALLSFSDGKLEEIWKNKNMRNQCNSSVLLDGYVYGFDGDMGGKGKLTCVEFATGTKKWSQEGLGTGSLMVADGKLIVLSEKGKLVIAQASPGGYQEISSAQILNAKCWTTPVLANGRIYARDAKKRDSDLVCIDVRSAKAGGSASAAGGSGWTQFRGANRDGKSAETGLLKKWPEGGPKLLWSVENKLGLGFSSVSISEGVIYTTGMIDGQGILFAFDLDGNLLWEQDYGPEWTGSHKGTRTTPTIDGDRLYVINGYANVVCLNKKTGKVMWSVDTKEKFGSQKIKWGISESPLIVDDKVICTPGGEKATMVALNKLNGETIWATEDFTDKACYSSPILVERGGRKIIVNQTFEYVVAVDADSGKVLWKDAFADIFGTHKNINPPSPLHYDGNVYVTSGYDDGGVMYELSADGSSFKRKWVDKTLDNHHGGVVLVDGYLYGSNWLSNSKGNWVCIEWDSAKVMYETQWQNKGPIIYADGMLYCYDEKDGMLALVKPTPEKFDVVSSFEITKGDGMHWGHPAIQDGRLYVRHGQALMAYDIKAD